MDEATKQAMLQRFADYLDDAPPTPPNAATETETERAPDLFTLLAETAALKNEVKLESRQVKAALERFSELFDCLRQANTRLEEELARQREREEQARREAERALLQDLLELHDRVSAGHEQAGRYQPPWLALSGRPTRFIEAMGEGLGMNLRRLDEILARRGVQAVLALNCRFDPDTMHAAEIRRDPDQEDGLVLDQTRGGFIQHGRLLRPAEVIVNKKDISS